MAVNIYIYPFGLTLENAEINLRAVANTALSKAKEVTLFFPKDSGDFDYRSLKRRLGSILEDDNIKLRYLDRVDTFQTNDGDNIVVFPAFEDFEGNGQFNREQLQSLQNTPGKIYLYPDFEDYFESAAFTISDLFNLEWNIKAKILSFGTIANLKSFAKQLGLKGYSKLSKDELVDLLKQEDFNIQTFISSLSNRNKTAATAWIDQNRQTTDEEVDLSDLGTTITFDQLCPEATLTSYSQIDVASEASYPILKELGLSPHLLSSEQIIKALNDLRNTKLPNYEIEVDRNDICHLPVFWHEKTPISDLRKMADAVYGEKYNKRK